MEGSKFWTPPEMWAGRPVLVVGGGPSLRGFDFRPARDACVIVVNNSHELVPWAEFLFFADRRWLEWNAKSARGFGGQMVTSSVHRMIPGTQVHKMEKSHDGPLPDRRWQVAGHDSGAQAVTLAAHLGAKRIVLAGFDMRFEGSRTHWHEGHTIESQEPNYTTRFFPQYAPLKDALAARGVELVRCTPSALTCIPEMSLPEALTL